MQLAWIAGSALAIIGLFGMFHVLRSSRRRRRITNRTDADTNLVAAAAGRLEATPLTAGMEMAAQAGEGQAKPNRTRRSRTIIQAEKLEREKLKDSCLAILDIEGIEHPAGHSKLVARYILRSENDNRIELMFERDEKSRANLWLSKAHAQGLLGSGIEQRSYPASDLYQRQEGGNKEVYGRHAGLKVMRDLAHTDLERFTLTSSDQMMKIIRHLKPM